jgi:hypothetical protein
MSTYNATAILSQLAASRGRARTRTLDASDVNQAMAQHAAVLAGANDDDVCAVTTLRGGFVPNSYGYRADCDEVRITSARKGPDDAWITEAKAGRVQAQSRPAGRGDLCISRLARAGQSMGRIVGAVRS